MPWYHTTKYLDNEIFWRYLIDKILFNKLYDLWGTSKSRNAVEKEWTALGDYG